MSKIDDRFAQLLSSESPSISEIQAAAFGGVPDRFRPQVWALLLGHLPLDRRERLPHVQRQRAQYAEFLRAVGAAGGDGRASSGFGDAAGAAGAAADAALASAAGAEGGAGPLLGGGGRSRSSAAAADDDDAGTSAGAGDGPQSPLQAVADEAAGAATAASPAEGSRAPSPPPTSPSSASASASASSSLLPEWQADEELRGEIAKDIERTNPDLNWFTLPSHTAPMERILFVYAKLNSGVRYVQGMNELLAPIWHVFANDAERRAAATAYPSASSPRPLGGGMGDDEIEGHRAVRLGPGEGEGGSSAGAGASPSPSPSPLPEAFLQQQALSAAEADTFFCFMSLMSEIRELFIVAHDNGDLGLKGTLTRFARLLGRREPAVAEHFRSMGMVPQMYALRWVTTLLSREFPFPEVIMLWDSLLADPHRFAFLLHLCVAMVRLQRDVLLRSPFGPCIQLLQRYPHTHFVALLGAALEVRAEDNADVVNRGLETEGGLWTTPIAMLGASPPPKMRVVAKAGGAKGAGGGGGGGAGLAPLSSSSSGGGGGGGESASPSGGWGSRVTAGVSQLGGMLRSFATKGTGGSSSPAVGAAEVGPTEVEMNER
jgi:hypothetical protein